MIVDVLRNSVSQTDHNMQGHRLLNCDTSNLAFGQFGPQLPHTVYAGPPSGALEEIPNFRLMTPDEFGAQVQSDTLDDLSALTPTNLGLDILQIPDTILPAYPRANGSETPPFWGLVTPAQVLADIGAQPASLALDALSMALPTQLGLAILTASSVIGGYAKFSSAGSGNLPSFLSAAQVAADIGSGMLPLSSVVPLLKGFANPTSLFRIDVEGITPGTTVVMTIPNYFPSFAPATITGPENLINKVINGLQLAVGTADDPSDDISYELSPAESYQLSLVALGVGASLIFRVTNPADVVVPETGTLTTEERLTAELAKHITAAPLTPSSTGIAGQTAYDADYEYRCVATNTWKRVLIEDWGG